MEGLTYITEEEKKKCRKVADAFAELYELTDVMTVDAGRFGFVRLQWFNEYRTFHRSTAHGGLSDGSLPISYQGRQQGFVHSFPFCGRFLLHRSKGRP